MDTPPPPITVVSQKALRLPCAPILLPRLIAVIRDSRSTATELHQLIRLDAALAAATLRTVNSAAYALAEPVADLGSAIIMLGYDEMYRLASVTSVARWEKENQAALPWKPGAFARYSLCLAVAAEMIASKTGADAISAYSVGIVANIGKLALTYICAPFYPEICELSKTIPWEEAEKTVLGYDNRDLSIVLLQAWNFPNLFIRTQLYRFRPMEAPEADRLFLAAMHAAEGVALALTPEGIGGEGFFEPMTEFIEQFGITEPLLDEVKIKTAQRVTKRFGTAFEGAAEGS